MDSFINTTWSSLFMVLFATVVIYTTLIILTRVAGLRSFTKMSSFDYGITIAIGAVIGATILTPNPPLLQAIVALTALYAIQILLGYWRGNSAWVKRLVDNQPILLMDGTNILYENMRRAKVTNEDLKSKLRSANITKMRQVKAVVMETSGEVSVLSHNDQNLKVDKELIQEVVQ